MIVLKRYHLNTLILTKMGEEIWIESKGLKYVFLLRENINFLFEFCLRIF